MRDFVRFGDDGGKSFDVSQRLGRQFARTGQILLITSGTGIVGGEKPVRSKPVEHLAQIGGAREDIVARFIGIATETIAHAQASPGVGHDLHQSHRAG